jgi:hypothetical protein
MNADSGGLAAVSTRAGWWRTRRRTHAGTTMTITAIDDGSRSGSQDRCGLTVCQPCGCKSGGDAGVDLRP